MLSVPVFNMDGQQTGQAEIDPESLGGEVRPPLLKQAIVAFLDRQRLYSARTKGKKHTAGSTRKLYRQKGTGNARAGQIRTPTRRGGGRAFAKRVPSSPVTFPKKMRRLARNNAILVKIQSQDALIVDGLRCSEPKTKVIAGMLSSLGVDRGCVLALDHLDKTVYLSSRNIPKTDVRLIEELTAYEVLRRKKLIFTRPAFDRLTSAMATRSREK
ncbi:MAG: 50S ribosomal protein L4 [Planctomycetota bacterium]